MKADELKQCDLAVPDQFLEGVLVLTSREHSAIATVESKAEDIWMVLSFQLYGLGCSVNGLLHMPQ